MKYLEKDYYVGLLNAAAYYGAAHQQPQTYSIITKSPALRSINTVNQKINLYIKKSGVQKTKSKRRLIQDI